MATIIVEDGTVVTGANSYISEADLTTYATDRGVTITGTNADLLIEAMDYIESLCYQGVKNTKAQPLLFPRSGLFIDDFFVDADVIPQDLIDALAETALAIDRSESPIADIERSTKKESVTSGLFVEYMDNASSTNTIRKIDAKLSKLILSGNNGISFNVFRV